MAHETPTIAATKRDRIGSRYAQRLRSAGKLPGIIYGHKQDPVAISIDHKQTMSLLESGVHILNIDVEGEGAETCLVKDLQFGYLGDNVVHVDLARVDLNEEVTVNVSLRFHGQPDAAKKAGSILSHSITDLEVVCKALNIPSEIIVELGEMEELFTVGELTLPEGVVTNIAPETPVATITFVAEEAEGEEVEVSSESEPEVITEAKLEDGDGKD